MITLYSGTPGSYKSYHAVADCITALKRGKNLITNFPLKYKNCIKKPIKGSFEVVNNLNLTVDYLINFACDHHKPGLKAQTLVVIDEASIKYNSRDFNMHDRMEWINFFANHRHFNFDFILITQKDQMLDKQIRGLIEVEIKHRSLKQYQLLGLLLGSVGVFMTVEYWYPCKLRTNSEMNIFNKRIASCYDTMGLFVDTKSKMAEARRKVQESQEVKTIVQVDDENAKKQVNENLCQLVNVLSHYVQCNSETAGSESSSNRSSTLHGTCERLPIFGGFGSNRKFKFTWSLPRNIYKFFKSWGKGLR